MTMDFILIILLEISVLAKCRESLGNNTFNEKPTEEDKTEVTVLISQNNGTYDPSCIAGYGECKSLQFAYKEALHRYSNTSTQRILFKMIDKIFMISQPIMIDIPSPNLRYLEISSGLLNTTMLSISPHASITVGCNGTNGIPCIEYSVNFKNLQFKNFQSLYPSVLIFFTAAKVALFGCEFIKNNCSAINSMDTPVEIIRTSFIENHGNGDFKQSEMGSFIGFPKSNLSTGGATAFIFQFVSNITVEVRDCFFSKNTASSKYHLPFIDHSVNDTEFPRVGAGAVFLFMHKTQDNKICLSNCNFTKNEAYSAGGIGALAESEASYNTLHLYKCTFESNKVFSTSGAILFAIWDQSIGNKMILDKCRFFNNFARFAGGIKLFLNSPSVKNDNYATSILEIKRSIFCSNYADTGSAMHFVFDSLYQQNYKKPVIIKNCTFCQHKIPPHLSKRSSKSNASLIYGGTILTHRVDIEFQGSNYIINNKAGCGLYASNANVYINGYVLFIGNAAVSAGGGMSLTDISRLIFYKGSHLRFENNYSGEKGGALAVITVGMPKLTYVHNPFCFIQYMEENLPHSKWDMKLEFIKNGAAIKGGAIFINTLTSCLWDEYPPHHCFEKALRWNDNFVYFQNYVDSTYSIISQITSNKTSSVDIATDTSQLVLTSPKQVTISPGEKVKFGLLALDELGNEIHSVATVESIARYANGTTTRSNLVFSNKYFVLTPYVVNNVHDLSFEVSERSYDDAFGDKSITHEARFSDPYSSFFTSVSMDIKPVSCRPGFYFDKLEKSCVCDTKLVKRCIGSAVLVDEGYWVTNKTDGHLIQLYCPSGYCKCVRPGDNLIGCVYDYLHPDKQCEDGRRGELCGSCKENLGLSLHTGDCIPCTQKSKTIAFFVTAVITVVVVAIIIVYLNPNFSTKLRGPTFYAQIVPYVFSNERALFFHVARGVASFAALGGPAGLPFNGCLSEKMDKLDVNALSYLFAVAILLVLFVVYVLDRFYVLNFTRDSPFEAFWILLVGIYVFFTETSLMFFYCVPIGDDGEVVFFYDGSLKCYHGRHLIMVIVSSVVLLFFVLLPPLLVIFMCFGVITVPLQVVDALTKGIREPVRWWWAIDLIRRLFFVAIYVFVPYEGMKRVSFVILSIFFLALHAHCQPYKSSFSNINETFLLFSISFLATMQVSDTDVSRTISSCIFMVTFIYISFLFLFLLFQFIRRRIKNRKFQEFENEGKQAKQKRPKTPERVNNVSI